MVNGITERTSAPLERDETSDTTEADSSNWLATQLRSPRQHHSNKSHDQ
jgi:hypothetical protein